MNLRELEKNYQAGQKRPSLQSLESNFQASQGIAAPLLQPKSDISAVPQQGQSVQQPQQFNPQEFFRGTVGEFDEAPQPTVEGAKQIGATIPFATISALKGVLQPVLGLLNSLGMNTEQVLNTAIDFYRKMIPPGPGIPNFTVGLDESGNYRPEIKQLPPTPLREIGGATAETMGFVGGPVNVAGRAGGLVTQKIAGSARPFFQSIARGMATGGLLGEGKKDETLENMALFGLFEPFAHLAGTIPDTIRQSTPWRQMTIKERGLALQSLDETLSRNPNMTEGEVLRQWNNPQWREEALSRRIQPERQAPARPTQPEVAEQPLPYMPGFAQKRAFEMQGQPYNPDLRRAQGFMPLREGQRPPIARPGLPPGQGFQTVGQPFTPPTPKPAIPPGPAQRSAETFNQFFRTVQSPQGKEALKQRLMEQEQPKPEQAEAILNQIVPGHDFKYEGYAGKGYAPEGHAFHAEGKDSPIYGSTISVPDLHPDTIRKTIEDRIKLFEDTKATPATQEVYNQELNEYNKLRQKAQDEGHTEQDIRAIESEADSVEPAPQKAGAIPKARPKAGEVSRPAEEKIVSAAIKLPDGTIHESTSHPQAVNELQQQGKKIDFSQIDRGFMTNTGRYVSPEEAADIGIGAGQLKERPKLRFDNKAKISKGAAAHDFGPYGIWEKSKTPEKPTKPQPGLAWVDDQKRPIYNAEEITKGKNKGKYRVTLALDKKVIVPADSIEKFPEKGEAAQNLNYYHNNKGSVGSFNPSDKIARQNVEKENYQIFGTFEEADNARQEWIKANREEIKQKKAEEDKADYLRWQRAQEINKENEDFMKLEHREFNKIIKPEGVGQQDHINRFNELQQGFHKTRKGSWWDKSLSEKEAELNNYISKQGKKAVPEKKEKPSKPIPKAKQISDKVRTLRGAILKLGKIDFLNFKGEVKNLPLAVQYLSKKSGMAIDLAEQALKDDGWLYPNESLLEVLEKDTNLKRDRIGKQVEEKKPSELTEQEKKFKTQVEREPEGPPKGEYVTMRAEDLPEGKKLTLIEDKTTDGWDIYEVKEKDPFEIKLVDGQTITLKPMDRVQVLKGDLGSGRKPEFANLIETNIDEKGNLTRGTDYFGAEFGKLPDADLEKAIEYMRSHDSPMVRRFLVEEAKALQRKRKGVTDKWPVEEFEPKEEKPKLELKGEKETAVSVAKLKRKGREIPKAKQETLTTAFETAKDKQVKGIRLEGERAGKKETFGKLISDIKSLANRLDEIGRGTDADNIRRSADTHKTDRTMLENTVETAQKIIDTFSGKKETEAFKRAVPEKIKPISEMTLDEFKSIARVSKPGKYWNIEIPNQKGDFRNGTIRKGAETDTKDEAIERAYQEELEAAKALADRQPVPSKKEKAGAAPSKKIEDFGEKIGGARKDTAERGFTKGGKKEKEQSKEPWRKKYVVMEKVDGSGWTIGKTGDRWGISARRGEVFATEAEAEKAIPLYAVAEAHRVMDRNRDGKFEVYKRVGKRKLFQVTNKEFPSREEGMKYMATHAEELLNLKTNFGEEILPVPEIAVRKGVERRTKDATPEMFMETFAPRGIEFGNWNNQAERQQVLNHAYDGLLDLADVLKVPPTALTLNGELSIAFGARGQGLSGAKAHYEPEYGVINLTKMKGAGSLAHEWFHSLDHYLARKDTKATSEKIKNKRGDLVYNIKGSDKWVFQSYGPSYTSELRTELKDAYNDLIQTMYKKAKSYTEDMEYADKFLKTARKNLKDKLDSIRKDLEEDLTEKYTWRKNKRGLQPASTEQLSEFINLSDTLLEGGNLELKYIPSENARSKYSTGRRSNETLESMSKIYKAVRNRTGFDSQHQRGIFDEVAAAMRTYAERLKMFEDAETGKEKTKAVPTSFAVEARKMDQARTGDYWSEPHEMAARAFSAYVEDKIAEQGNQSDFIVYHAHGGILLPMIDGFVARPYPEGQERIDINKAFDKFIDTIEVKNVEKEVGGVKKILRSEIGSIDIDLNDIKKAVKSASIKLPKKDMTLLEQWTSIPTWVSDKYGKDYKPIQDVIDNRFRNKNIIRNQYTKELLEAWNPLNKKERKHVGDMLWKGDQLGKVLKDSGLAKLNKQERRAYLVTREVLDYIWFEDRPALMKELGMTDNEIQQYRNQAGRQIGYMPHPREGRYYARAKTPTGEVLYREHFNDIVATLTKRTPIPLGPKTKLKVSKIEKMFDDAIVEYGENVKDLAESAYFDISPEVTQELIDAGIRRLEASEIEKENLKKALQKAIADVFKMRGFMAHAIERQKIPGFDKSNWQDAVLSYVSGWAGYKSKLIAAREMWDAWGKVDWGKKPKLRAFADKQVRDTFANDTFTDRAIDKARAVLFRQFLSGNIKSAALQLTQNYIAAIPRLTAETNWAGIKVQNSMNKAAKDILTTIPGPNWEQRRQLKQSKRITKEEARGINRARENGIISTQTTDELLGQKAGKFGTKLRKVDAVLAWLFRNMELFNRETTYLAAFRIGKEKGMTYEEAADFAEKIIDESHWRYGKLNLPPFARGGAKAGRAPYAFRHYAWNLIKLWEKLGSRTGARGKWGLAKSFAALLFFGGALAIPFIESIEWAYSKITGESLLSQIAELTGKWSKYALYGVPGGALDIDLTGSLGTDIPKSVEDILGAPTEWAKRTVQTIEDIQAGDVPRSAEDFPLNPTFTRNIMKAIRLKERGLEKRSGQPVMDDDFEKIKLSGREAGQQAIGFRPTKLSEHYRHQRSTSLVKSYWQDKKSDLMRRWAVANNRFGRGSQQVNDVMEDIRAYNRDKPNYIPAITKSDFKRRAVPGRSKREVLLKREVQ